MYASYGSLDEGKRVLDTLPVRDEVSWGAMLDGCAGNGDGFLALELFEKMQKEGLEPNRVVLLLVLKSCGIIGAVKKGHTLHNQIIDLGLVTDIETGTTLIDMYSNCGCLRDAHTVLDMLPTRDASSWNALIAGYSQHGDSSLALQCLKDMQSQGLKPDSWTFTNILSACSHAGQVEKGYNMFMDMRERHNLMPRREHFNCLIDILGRVGRLDEAEKLLHSMPKVPNVTGWLTLLTACRTFGRNELGRICYREAVCLDAEKASLYMLMSNICQDL
jgi:pentatricopeptide repeat protein